LHYGHTRRTDSGAMHTTPAFAPPPYNHPSLTQRCLDGRRAPHGTGVQPPDALASTPRRRDCTPNALRTTLVAAASSAFFLAKPPFTRDSDAAAQKKKKKKKKNAGGLLHTHRARTGVYLPGGLGLPLLPFCRCCRLPTRLQYASTSHHATARRLPFLPCPRTRYLFLARRATPPATTYTAFTYLPAAGELNAARGLCP